MRFLIFLLSGKDLPLYRSGFETPSNKMSVTKSAALDSNSFTHLHPLRMNFLIKSLTRGLRGSVTLAAIPVMVEVFSLWKRNDVFKIT